MLQGFEYNKLTFHFTYIQYIILFDSFISSGESMDVINKTNGHVVMSSNTAASAEVDRAVACARETFQTFRDMTAAERGQLLLKAGIHRFC